MDDPDWVTMGSMPIKPISCLGFLNLLMSWISDIQAAAVRGPMPGIGLKKCLLFFSVLSELFFKQCHFLLNTGKNVIVYHIHRLADAGFFVDNSFLSFFEGSSEMRQVFSFPDKVFQGQSICCLCERMVDALN